MKKTVILSTNNNPNYLSYLPYTIKAWNLLGWSTFTYLIDGANVPDLYPDTDLITNTFCTLHGLGNAPRIDTESQVVRLFAGKHIKEGIIMIGDVDMIPLSNYWNPDPNEITCYGIDLTGDEQIPMCYVAASVENWNKIIPEQTIPELLEKYPQAYSPNFQDYWFVDQNILTERINKLSYTRIDRGFNGNLAAGRIDRADWERTVTMGGKKIDAHCLRPFNLEQTERVMKLIELPQ